MQFTELEKKIINQLQGGFPISERPFADAAKSLDISEQQLMETIQDLLDRKVISRFGPLFDIEKSGGAFCLCAVSTEKDQWQETAQILNELPEVAHNYLRTHKYNLWFVLATETKELMSSIIKRIEELTQLPVLALPKEKEFFIGLHLEI